MVTDTLPGSVTFVSATPSQGSCSQAAGVVTCPLGVVPFGATATITIVVTTTIDGLDHRHRDRVGDDVRSRARQRHGQRDHDGDARRRPAHREDRRGRLGGRRHVHDLHHHAHERRTLHRAGRRGHHRCDPRRDERLGGRGRTVPSPVTTFTCTTSAPLASGASVSFQLTLAIPAAYALPSVSNTATISSTPIVDPNPANDSATDVDALATSADLSITKTDAVDPVALGDNVVYTITVTNNGPSDAAGVVVTDALPGFTNFVSAIAQPGELLAGRGHRDVSARRDGRRQRRDDHGGRGDHGRRRHHQPGDGHGDHARPRPREQRREPRTPRSRRRPTWRSPRPTGFWWSSPARRRPTRSR